MSEYRNLHWRETIEPGDEALRNGAWEPATGIGGTVGSAVLHRRVDHGWVDLSEGTRLLPGDQVKSCDSWVYVSFQSGVKVYSSGPARRPKAGPNTPSVEIIHLGPTEVVEPGDAIGVSASGAVDWGSKAGKFAWGVTRRYRYLSAGEHSLVGDEWEHGGVWCESSLSDLRVSPATVGKVRRRVGPDGKEVEFFRIVAARINRGLLSQDTIARILNNVWRDMR